MITALDLTNIHLLNKKKKKKRKKGNNFLMMGTLKIYSLHNFLSIIQQC